MLYHAVRGLTEDRDQDVHGPEYRALFVADLRGERFSDSRILREVTAVNKVKWFMGV